MQLLHRALKVLYREASRVSRHNSQARSIFLTNPVSLHGMPLVSYLRPGWRKANKQVLCSLLIYSVELPAQGSPSLIDVQILKGYSHNG